MLNVIYESPPLSLEEYSQLEKNIIADGCREPLVLWRPESIACPECDKGSMTIGEHEFETLSNELDKWITESEECWVCKDCDYTKNIHEINSILMDGHNRYEICAKNNIGFDVSYKYFTDSSHAKEWMILNQFGRRNLINYQRSVLALELDNEYSARAKKQQGKRTDICQTSDKCNPIDTKKELAKVANVSHDTIAKVKKKQSTATQEVKDKLESGEVSINEAYKAVKSGNTHVSNNSGENEWYASTVTNILKRA